MVTDPEGLVGGLCLWWNNSVSVDILQATKHLIDTKVTISNGGIDFHASWIYGTPYKDEKNVWWNWINHAVAPNGLPWICFGDYNEIMWTCEKMGGRTLSQNHERFLLNFMNRMELVDLGYKGQVFTWSGRRGEGLLVQERLDRCLIDVAWQETWPCSVATHLPTIGLDHCPILLEIEVKCAPHGKPFKFGAF